MIFLKILFVAVCLFLMLSILLQSGKGEGLSGTFGGSSQFMGGRAAATFLTKTTTALAATFMLLCVVISILSKTAVTAPEGQSEAQRRLSETPPAQVAPSPQAPSQAPQGRPAPVPTTTPGGPQ